MRHRCDNCSKEMDEPFKELSELRDLSERLDPGSVVPSGECECGAFCYPIQEVNSDWSKAHDMLSDLIGQKS